MEKGKTANKKITLEEIIEDDEAVISCPTEEQADVYCHSMRQRRRKWSNGQSYHNHSHWVTYGSDTCYFPSGNKYGSLSCYKAKGWKVHEFDEVDFGNPKRGLKIAVRIVTFLASISMLVFFLDMFGVCLSKSDFLGALGYFLFGASMVFITTFAMYGVLDLTE